MKGSRQTLQAIAGILMLGLLAGCAGSPLGERVEQSLEADPQLEESPPFQAAEAETAESQETTPSDSTDAETGSEETRDDNAIAPEPGEPNFIGPVPSRAERARTARADADDRATAAPASPSALTGIPADLQSYIRDLQAIQLLEVAKTAKTEDNAAASPFSQTITRREYARWLFDSYNTIYADEPGERLRPGNPNDEPAFQDVSPANPDYAAIQGLAEAGIIPSAFTGNSTAVNFRPDAPLVREDLILWKVPLDIQSALPTTTPEAVTQAWGFQDTGSIDPLALRAIAADFQLGDFSNFRRAFGYTTLFRPDKAVSRAEAAAVLWRFGNQTEGRTAADVIAAKEPPSSN